MDTFAVIDHEINLLLEEYQERPMYEDIFESMDEEGGKITAKNAEIEEKSMNLIQKGIDAIKKIFKKIKEILATIKTWMGVDKEEKTAYEQFVKECKENPEFAGLKVTIKDYREINKRLDSIVGKAEKEYKQFKDQEAEDRPSIIKDMQKGMEDVRKTMANIAASEGSAVAMEVALNYARACKENAAQVEFMLNFDMGLLDEIEKEIGKKSVKKFKRNIRWLQSRSKMLRYIAGGRQQQAKTIQESLKETLSAIKNVGTKEGRKTFKKIQRTASGNEDVRNMHKGIANTAKGSVAFAGKAVKGVAHDAMFTHRAYKNQMKHEQKVVKKAEREAYRENKKH